jgi:4-hydroxybenzoyl-CoA thioesterase
MNGDNSLHNFHTIRVLWTDCDPAGIAFYGNYYKWMDEAAYYLFKAGGIRWEEWRSRFDALGIPLFSAHADFSSPTRMGDELTIESWVSEWGKSSFEVTHRFMNGDRLAADGYEKRVWCLGDPTDPSTFKSAPIPDEVREALGG